MEGAEVGGVTPVVSRPLEGVVLVWSTPRWREREMLPSYRLRKKAVDDENERQVGVPYPLSHTLLNTLVHIPSHTLLNKTYFTYPCTSSFTHPPSHTFSHPPSYTH